MNWRNVRVVYRKEFTDMMRDRRTLVAMFLFPIIIFPIMTAGFGEFMESSVRKLKAEKVRVMLLGEEHAPPLAARFRAAEGLEIAAPSPDYAQQISDKKLRAAIEFPPDFEKQLQAATGAPPTVKIYFYMAEFRSENAARRAEEVIRAYREEVVAARLTSHGLPASILKPVEGKGENVATAEKVGGSRLGAILPYLIVFLCLMGAMHPAMDLTAGEKERGTLETILASSVGRGELVIGKFLLVLTVSLTTALVSLASYGVSVRLSPTYMQEITRGQSFSISGKAIGAVILLVLPMAVLFAASLVAISLLARNYKEAQSYIGPLMIVVILPAMAGMLPGVELSPALAMIPIVNISLVSKEIFTGSFPWLAIAITFVSTCAFAALALVIAYQMFQREEVLFRT